MVLKDLKFEGIIYQMVLSRTMTSSSMKKTYSKTIGRNKKVNKRSRQSLYHRMFVGLWLHQKSW